jgi:mevalonate kinase
MIQLAIKQGAAGAKMTGAGGGGSMIALCEDKTEPVATSLINKGFKVLQVKL